VLAPLQCWAILWAAIMGWLVWRDAPTLPIIACNAIISGPVRRNAKEVGRSGGE
jgi:S-adenosylmethionine uptake transporter